MHVTVFKCSMCKTFSLENFFYVQNSHCVPRNYFFQFISTKPETHLCLNNIVRFNIKISRN